MKKKFKAVWNYLLVALVISLTIIVINNLNRQLIPQIIQDINSGVIGAILTTIITLVLLSNQTENQEYYTKNSVIYEEKLKLFNSFFSLLAKSLEDGKLTHSELKNIIFSFASIRVHLSVQNANEIEQAIQGIDEEFFFVDENLIPNYNRHIELFNKISNVFRRELYHEKQSEELENFSFHNFNMISFKRRIKKLPVTTFEQAVSHFDNCKKIIFETAENITITFDISDALINKMKSTHQMLTGIFNELSEFKISKIYLLNEYSMNDKKFLGTLNIFYHFNNFHIATFSISEKNRICISIKFAKISVYTFDEDTIIEDYTYNIREDLKKIINANLPKI